MKKIYLTFAVCLLAAIQSNAQKATKSVFAELAGPGIASINFDSRFQKKNDGFGGRIGIGGFSIDGENLLTIPVAVNYLLGKDDRNYFELGAGYTYLKLSSNNNFSDDDVFSTSFGHLNLGYRLQPAAGGFQFRAAVTPIFGSNFFVPYYFSLSFGYAF